MEASKRGRGRPRKNPEEGNEKQRKGREYMRKYQSEIKQGITQLEKDEKDCLKELDNIRKQRAKLIDELEKANTQAGTILKEANGMVFVQLSKSDQEGKKYKAVFYKEENRQKIRTVHFGAVGYQDFTQHKDEDRKQAYLARHKINEEWSDYMTAGSLSRHLLWSKPSLSASYNAYLKKFGLKKY